MIRRAVEQSSVVQLLPNNSKANLAWSSIGTPLLHVSAPGKVILHGEHSVVYGKLAVAASLGLRTHLYLSEEPSNDANSNLHLEFTDVNVKLSLPVGKLHTALHIELPISFTRQKSENFPYEEQIKRIEMFIEATIECRELQSDARNALIAFLLLYMALIPQSEISHPSLRIRVTSDIRVGSGMGSSAAFVVCIVAAFISYNKHAESGVKTFTSSELELISAWSLQGERVMHGNPSGIDTTLATYGSIVAFRKGAQPQFLPMAHAIRAIFINTNVPKDTRAMIAKVIDLKARFPEIVQNTFDSMELVAKTAIDCLTNLNHLEMSDENAPEINSCYTTMNTLIGINQNLLRILNVSHAAIEDICSVLSTFGLNGKITGAGGGGFVLSLLPPDFHQLQVDEMFKRLTSDKYECFMLQLGGPGVRIE